MYDHTIPTAPLRIRELPVDQRPIPRLLDVGTAALADTELLAILIQADTLDAAAQLLHRFGGWHGLARATPAELQQQGGIGPARCAQIKAALEIGRRQLLACAAARFLIRAPADAADLLMLEMGHLDQEHFRTILLDTKNRVQQIVTVYIGTLDSAHVRVCEVFKVAVQRNSAAIILAHNHPSSDPEPSPQDVQVTRDVVQAGQLLGITVLDHLVIGQGRFISMRERGLGFAP